MRKGINLTFSLITMTYLLLAISGYWAFVSLTVLADHLNYWMASSDLWQLFTNSDIQKHMTPMLCSAHDLLHCTWKRRVGAGMQGQLGACSQLHLKMEGNIKVAMLRLRSCNSFAVYERMQ